MRTNIITLLIIGAAVITIAVVGLFVYEKNKKTQVSRTAVHEQIMYNTYMPFQLKTVTEDEDVYGNRSYSVAIELDVKNKIRERFNLPRQVLVLKDLTREDLKRIEELSRRAALKIVGTVNADIQYVPGNKSTYISKLFGEIDDIVFSDTFKVKGSSIRVKKAQSTRKRLQNKLLQKRMEAAALVDIRDDWKDMRSLYRKIKSLTRDIKRLDP